MKAICGFFRLDGAAADSRQLATMRTALVCNPAANPATFDGRTSGPIGLGTAEWARTPTRSIEPSLHYDAESGCVAVADARLNERDILAKRLGLSTQDGPGAMQAGLILHAYLRWGEQCAAELYGDFSIAIWDPRHQRLFCARDIMGVRPLYLHYSPTRLFAFASRAETLLCLPGIPKDLDEGRIADFLVNHLEGIDRTSTFYRAIERLPPAHSATIQTSGSQRQRYWRLQSGLIRSPPSTDAQWAAALTNVLENAVRSHLAGDERVGCMISGGLDSSSLAVIAKDQLAAADKQALPTFSSVDDDPACLETHAIRAMLELPGFAPTAIGPDEFDAMRTEIAAAVWHCEEPFDAAMVLLHVQYLAAARIGVQAVMDGVDGDVLFSDSGGLVRQLHRGQWRTAWRNARGNQRIYCGEPAWKAIGLAMRYIVTPGWLRESSWQRQLRTNLQARQFIRSSLISPDFAARVNLADRLRRYADARVGSLYDEASHSVTRIEQIYTTCGMERYRRVGAWHGVDPRHPFADRRVLELCVNLPDAERMSDGWSKFVLRRAMQSRLPAGVCWRADKQHLGLRLIGNLVRGEVDTVQPRLTAYRSVLSSFMNMNKLDVAARNWQQADRTGSQVAILDALTLGDWLMRHAKANAM